MRTNNDIDAEQPDGILGQVVTDASQYVAMKTPGSLQPPHFFPPFSGELVLVTVPDAMNPLDLINSEVVVGGRKEGVMVAGGHKYKIGTYPADTSSSTSLPCLFLPDQDGQLTKVPVEMKASLVIKGEVEETEEYKNNCVDIETLRSIPYKMPKGICRRDFFTQTRPLAAMTTPSKPGKKKKKVRTSHAGLDDSVLAEGQNLISPKKRKTNT